MQTRDSGRMRDRAAMVALVIALVAGLTACDEGASGTVPAGTNGDVPGASGEQGAPGGAPAGGTTLDALLEVMRTGTRT